MSTITKSDMIDFIRELMSNLNDTSSLGSHFEDIDEYLILMSDELHQEQPTTPVNPLEDDTNAGKIAHAIFLLDSLDIDTDVPMSSHISMAKSYLTVGLREFAGLDYSKIKRS